MLRCSWCRQISAQVQTVISPISALGGVEVRWFGSYYDNSDTQAIVLVYDITNYESFQHLDKWLKDVQSKVAV